jgi:tRNA dimethylallyltransferase
MDRADGAEGPGASASLVVALVGATATGKTDVGEALADAIGGMVVCADSRQVFRELELGTGKPSPAGRTARPHALFDALSLGQRASAGWYAEAAARACAAARAAGLVPILVGGSGLWLRAAQHGLSQAPPHDPVVRERVRRELEQLGPEALHARLAAVDPETAARLAPRDRQRVARALEVFEASGRPLSAWHRQSGSALVPGRWRVFELTAAAAALDERIARRTRWMFDAGLVDEVRALVAAGLEAPLRALRAVGYDEALDLAAGACTRAEAEGRTNRRTRQLAKRQRTWFRHQVEATRLDSDGRGAEELLALVRGALR